jgi:uridine kinase
LSEPLAARRCRLNNVWWLVTFVTDPEKRPYVVGVAGGTGSGKTTVARSIQRGLSPDDVVLIEQDGYYRDLSHLSFEERSQVNFDHPDALEIGLLIEHIAALCEGRAIDKPVYDFERHLRVPETERVSPRPVVLVEGILVLADQGLRDLMDLKLFVDTDPDIRVIRRIRRDLEQRGRTFEQVRRQYYLTVRPMHVAFVEPSKRHADVIIPEGGQNRVALDVIVGRIREFLREYHAR